jgi:hypothetical protein
MKKAVWLLFILSLITRHVIGQKKSYELPNGTSIVTYITKDSIWLSTDSKSATDINAKRTGYTTVCKIKEYHNVFMAMAGIPMFIYNGKTIWDSYDEVVKELKTDTSLIASYSALVKKLGDQMTQLYGSYIQNRSNAEVMDLFSVPNKVLLQATISGFNVRHKPFHANWLYYLNGNRFNWRIMSSEQALIDGDKIDLVDHTDISLAGEKDSIWSFLHSPIQKEILQPKSRMDRLIYLINLEVSKDSNNVGLPINVVVIYKNGHKWLTKNNVCKLVGRY